MIVRFLKNVALGLLVLVGTFVCALAFGLFAWFFIWTLVHIIDWLGLK